jgi:hypothetical protein
MIVWRGSDDFDKVAVAEKFVNTARIIASFLLHFTMVPEIKTALRMTQYCKDNYHKYRDLNATFAFMVSVFKMIGGVFCDVINLYVICLCTNIGDVIGSYVAFEIIACIDDILVCIVNFDVAAAIEDTGF